MQMKYLAQMLYFQLLIGKMPTFFHIKTNTYTNLANCKQRIGLVEDLAPLCTAGYIKASTALDYIIRCKTESSSTAMASMRYFLVSMSQVFWEYDDVRTALENLQCDIYGPLIDKLGFESMEGTNSDETSYNDRELRSIALNGAVSANYEP